MNLWILNWGLFVYLVCFGLVVVVMVVVMVMVWEIGIRRGFVVGGLGGKEGG